MRRLCVGVASTRKPRTIHSFFLSSRDSRPSMHCGILAFLFSCVFVHGHECDDSADILFIQDIQDSMERELHEIEDDIDDVMDEFQKIFHHPRFGLVTFKEIDGLGCIDIVRSLSRRDDPVEDAYEELKARTPASVRNYGSPLAGLLAGLAWEDIDWRSANRIILLITNNMPTAFREPNPHAWPMWHDSHCHRVVQPPEDLVLDYAKLAGTTILFVVPRASNVVVGYWERFNAKLGQHAGLINLSSHDLDDWIEEKKDYFRLMQARNCYGGNHFSSTQETTYGAIETTTTQYIQNPVTVPAPFLQ
eukprot:Gregarina_sp_Pseudo_9__1448@NODE_1972_length_1225_cov_121_839798_g1826_i0_p1_GENE_NODE_1972_length_1225_cov_121_839798_g1826_i0NODE_1972_length_1225_cov_121_839798_g1826_i0_p1_ORF_typecomplete_len305_score50_96Integrin_beta/PF00362_18/0_0004VWA/PF00092_28/0_0098VWA_2/PF13519_6/0_17_NODE_1972_length_1225_cov_121_839798_g1826_i01101024